MAVCSLRTGVDLVTIAAPRQAALLINSFLPDLITSKLPGPALNQGHVPLIMRLMQKNDVMLIGPGLGRHRNTLAAAKRIIETVQKPKIIDADALYVSDLRRIENALLTPHSRELLQVLRNSGVKRVDAENVPKKALGTNVILAKGHHDRIITKAGTLINKTGNPGMTVGGTGDVLAGLCAGFAAQGFTLQEAAMLAAYCNGMAGDTLYMAKGYCYTASDVVQLMPGVIRQLAGVPKHGAGQGQ